MTTDPPADGRPDTTAPQAAQGVAHDQADDARAAIVVVGRDARALQTLGRELSGRYGADYRIVVCGDPAELDARVRDLLQAGTPVALVIGDVGEGNPDGIEVLARVRTLMNRAAAASLVGRADGLSGRRPAARRRSARRRTSPRRSWAVPARFRPAAGGAPSRRPGCWRAAARPGPGGGPGGGARCGPAPAGCGPARRAAATAHAPRRPPGRMPPPCPGRRPPRRPARRSGRRRQTAPGGSGGHRSPAGGPRSGPRLPAARPSRGRHGRDARAADRRHGLHRRRHAERPRSAACGAGSPATAAGSWPLAPGAVLAPSGFGWGRVAEPRRQMARSGSGATFLGRDKEHLRPA